MNGKGKRTGSMTMHISNKLNEAERDAQFVSGLILPISWLIENIMSEFILATSW
jgi:hypothetical protein